MTVSNYLMADVIAIALCVKLTSFTVSLDKPNITVVQSYYSGLIMSIWWPGREELQDVILTFYSC